MNGKEDEMEELKREVEQLRMALARSAGIPTRAPTRNTLPGTSLKMILLSLAVLLPLIAICAILVLASWWISGPWSGVPIGVTLGGLEPILDPLSDQLGPLLENLTGVVDVLDKGLSDIVEVVNPFVKLIELLTRPLEWFTDLFP